MIYFFILPVLFKLCLALSGKHVLILTETLNSRDKYSLFFNSLQDRGYNLHYKAVDDASNLLRKYNENLYDHLIIFAPSVEEFGGQIKVEEILKFIDAGGNVLVAGNSDIGDPLRELAVENGFEFDQAGTSVIDHFHFVTKDDGKRTHIWVDMKNNNDTPIIIGNSKKSILYNGIGLLKDPKNELVIDILNGYPTSYCYSPLAKQMTEYPHAIGKGLSLVAGIQALNNARVVFSGSIDLFSNDFFDIPMVDALTQRKLGISGNKDFTVALSKWVFRETGVLRASKIKHYKKGDSTINPNSYTITDIVSYEMEIETKDEKGTWVPYTANDVQMEFVRIDPFIRTDLASENGKYKVDFKLPDVYGVFQFKVDYLRKGYTHLFVSKQVSVRPFEHTQYERFILSAYPYYASAFLMMFMFYLLTFIVLYYKEDKKTKSE